MYIRAGPENIESLRAGVTTSWESPMWVPGTELASVCVCVSVCVCGGACVVGKSMCI